MLHICRTAESRLAWCLQVILQSTLHLTLLLLLSAQGFKVLSSTAGCCTGSSRSELCRLLPVSASVPRAELLCLKDAHLCRNLQSSPVPCPSAENSADTTNLLQELQGSWEKNRHPQKRHHFSALFSLLYFCTLVSGCPVPPGCAFLSMAMIPLASSPHPVWL